MEKRLEGSFLEGSRIRADLGLFQNPCKIRLWGQHHADAHDNTMSGTAITRSQSQVGQTIKLRLPDQQPWLFCSHPDQASTICAALIPLTDLLTALFEPDTLMEIRL